MDTKTQAKQLFKLADELTAQVNRAIKEGRCDLWTGNWYITYVWKIDWMRNKAVRLWNL